MSKLKISNNAVSRLSANISPADTSISLLPGGGAKFPPLATGEWFPATLIKVDGTIEIVRVTARATDVLTIIRGQESTAAIAFNAGDRVEHRFTAKAYTEENARVEEIAQTANDLATSFTGANGSSLIGHLPLGLGAVPTTVEAELRSLDDMASALQLADYAALRAYTGQRKSVYVTGYLVSTAPSGTSGLFIRDDSDTVSADNGGTIIVAGSVRWKLDYKGGVSVKQFGCKWDGSVDDTARAQAALDWVVAHGGQLNFPAYGTGGVTELFVRQSLYTVVLHNEGSYLEARASVATNSILNFIGCVDVHMTGMWRFNGGNNNNYRSALSFRVNPVTGQPTTRVNVHNPTFRNCPIGISVGEFANDLQCSEINVFGANFFQTPIPIYNGGSNSGAQYIGCNITSEPNSAFVGVIETAIWQEGGFVKVTGGSIVTNPSASYTITENPCQSALYGNLYGTLDVVGAHIESNSPLLNINNPRSLASPGSDTSTFKFIGNTGYAGGDTARDFIYINDPNYVGLVKTLGNNWYASVPRTGLNMSGLAQFARFETDKNSLGKNFLNWLGGIGYGIAIHDFQPVISVSGLGVTYSAGITDTLKFQIKDVANELGKYGNQYNPATGEFTVPPGGFSRLQVQCYIAGTGATSGSLTLSRAGSIVAYGTFTAAGISSGSLNATLHKLVAGEVVKVLFTPLGSNFVTDNGIYNSLQISGETR